MHIDSYKPAKMKTTVGGNNHGSILDINGEWYVFYHRHTNGSWFCRQGCVEKIKISDDGNITQAEMTSLGANGIPLTAGRHPAYIACNLFNADGKFTARITQDGRDCDKEIGYIADITDSTVIGFKYFECVGIKKIKIITRGYCNGVFEIRTTLHGEILGRIPVEFSNIWEEFSAEVSIPDGVHALYFTYTGNGTAQFASFEIEAKL
jgi:hypothetical protein